jgi:cell division protein FtsB
MLQLEKSNNDLSEENEKLKKGGKDAVEAVTDAGQLANHIELLTTKLSGKADEIKKLLAENKKLTDKLSIIEKNK